MLISNKRIDDLYESIQMTESNPALKTEIRGLHFYHESNHALKNINIAISERQITKEPGYMIRRGE